MLEMHINYSKIHTYIPIYKLYSRASLVFQWLGIHFTMQGTQVQSLGWEHPTCHAATKPMCYICRSLHTLSWCSITREATAMRSRHAATRQESPLTATRESPHSSEDPVQPKINT